MIIYVLIQLLLVAALLIGMLRAATFDRWSRVFVLASLGCAPLYAEAMRADWSGGILVTLVLYAILVIASAEATAPARPRGGGI